MVTPENLAILELEKIKKIDKLWVELQQKLDRLVKIQVDYVKEVRNGKVYR